MKNFRKAFGDLPLLITVMLAILTVSLPTNAKLHYRGFVEGGIGITTVSGDSERKDNGGGVAFGYMLSTTHGIQLKKNFIGLGLGIMPGYCAIGSYYSESTGYLRDIIDFNEGHISKIFVPVFLSWRYDFFKDKGWRPYLGAKGGVCFPGYTDWEYKYAWINYEGDRIDASRRCKIFSNVYPYVSFDFGVRKNFTSSSGISFGLSIQIIDNSYLDSRLSMGNYLGWQNESNYSILLKLGFDF